MKWSKNRQESRNKNTGVKSSAISEATAVSLVHGRSIRHPVCVELYRMRAIDTMMKKSWPPLDNYVLLCAIRPFHRHEKARSRKDAESLAGTRIMSYIDEEKINPAVDGPQREADYMDAVMITSYLLNLPTAMSRTPRRMAIAMMRNARLRNVLGGFTTSSESLISVNS